MCLPLLLPHWLECRKVIDLVVVSLEEARCFSIQQGRRLGHRLILQLARRVVVTPLEFDFAQAVVLFVLIPELRGAETRRSVTLVEGRTL